MDEIDGLVAVAVLAAFLTSAALTWVIIRYARSGKLLDAPNARSAHRQPTPRGGGLAIAIAAQGATLLSLAAGWLEPSWGLALLGAGFALAGIGWIDDHGHVRAGIRLAVHFGADVGAVFPEFEEFLEHVSFPGWGRGRAGRARSCGFAEA